ncbi:MAG: trigger factor [Desulfoplanes sp.]
MEYTVEEISPVKRKVNVEVAADEVNASISATIALYRRDVDIKGFRKGKVPAQLIETRYGKKLYSEATQDLINYHINTILNEMEVTPIGRLDMAPKGSEILEKGKPFAYSFAFEVMPSFDLPEYKGLKVEEEEVVIKEEEVDRVIERMRDNAAKLVRVDEIRTAQDGDVVMIDFEGSKDGKPLEGIKAENFELLLGEGSALKAFEDIVKKLKAGEKGSGTVVFPADFLNKELAGQEVEMKVNLHSIKKKDLPEVNDAFAANIGGYKTVQELRDMIHKSYATSSKNLHKSAAQKKLLDELKDQVTFDLPPVLVEAHIDQKIHTMREKMEQQGKSMESVGKTPEELRAQFREDAEDIVKAEIFLMAVAEDAELEVQPQEVDLMLQKMAMQSGQDFNALKDYYEQNNLMVPLRDRALQDKAMDLIYDQAEVTIVPAAEHSSADV